ncbi:secretin N-terminal domain-containing protein [Granulicella sp. L60]|uniref:secretin N-terminal domain-containing protein n=1 Tax=Granulicella sp. L60 TaxID=1641866 RepID=UPI00131D1B99|nr:secretin N-terminal domain-containing protein [Granulicella sp. L60]
MAAEQRGDLDSAYLAYGLALDKDPTDMRFKVSVARVRTTVAMVHVRRGEQLQKQSHSKEALVEFFRALEIDPGNAIAEQEIERTKEELEKKDKGDAVDDGPSAEDLDRPGPPTHLDPLPTEPVSMNMTEETRILYETIGKMAGVSVLIDPDFTSKRVTMAVKDITDREALNLLAKLSNSFWIPITHNTIYVAQDTRAKHQQLEELAVRTFYLSNVSQQNDLNEIVTTLRNVLAQDAKLFAVPGQNAIVVRGTPDEILLARQLIASLDLAKPEVLVDIYVMEVSRTKVHAMGISPPTSFSVTQNSNTTSSGSTTSSTLNQVGRSSSYSYTIGQAQAELLLTDTDTRVLQNPRVRAIDGQKASLNIGQRIPIATGSFSTPTTASASSVQTQFQYIDVGVNIELTPTIHDNRDVTMKIHVEISSQTGTDTISGVAEPVISQDKAEQVVRMKDGEVSIMAGLVQNQLALAVSGWPGLGELPGIKYMFSTQSVTKTTDELVFMLVPHVVREFGGQPGATHEFSTGASDSVQINRVAPVASRPILQKSNPLEK